MFRKILALGLTIGCVGLAACSLFERRNDNSMETAKGATPLDMPAKSNDGMQVTMVNKDGTPIETTNGTLMSANPAVNEEAVQIPPKAATPAEASAMTVTTAKVATEGHAWGYDGQNGPNNWATMKPEYAQCGAGKMQSPIDLKWRKPAKGTPVAVSYKHSKAFVSDSGHAIQVAFDNGGTVNFGGRIFDLQQVHFHSPSEHMLTGKQFPLEAHFVNKSADGKLTVLAVFFKEGKENPTLAKIWNAIPAGHGPASSADLEISPREMMGPTKTYYEYTGSLTTPPCTEGVNWIVFNSPLTVSKGQLEALHKYYVNNNRPAQPLNGRKVVNY